MKKKTRRKLLLLIIIVAIVAIVIFVKKGRDGSEPVGERKLAYTETRFDINNLENAKMDGDLKKNISDKVQENKTYQELEISNIKIESNIKSGVTEFTATITNNGDANFEEKNVYVVFLNKDGVEIGRMTTLISDIASGESKEISSFSALDISNCYDIKIEEL